MSAWGRPAPSGVMKPSVPIWEDRKSTRLNSSHLGISYAVFCLKKNNLGNVFAAQGQYEKAAEITRQGMHRAPDQLCSYGNLANCSLSWQHFDDVLFFF